MNDPLTARFRYKHRNSISFGAGFVVLISLLFAFCYSMPAFSFFYILIAVVAWILYVRVVRDRVIWIRCDKCGNDIATNTSWVCGLCGNVHTNATLFPFVGVCSSCGDEPKAYQCDHDNGGELCGELIFLSKSKVRIGYATSLNMHIHQKQISDKKDEEEEEIEKLDKELKIIERKLRKAKLDIRLKEFTEALEPPKKKTSYDELEEYYKGMMGNEDAAKKWKAAIDEEFKNDPVEREKRHRVVDQWMMNRL